MVPLARRLPAAVMLVALLLAACGDDDTFTPTVETVAGSYSATSFNVVTGDGSVDPLASGAQFAVTLAPDGTTAGRLFVPGSAAVAITNGEDLEADLAGTWSLSGTAVTLTPAVATFVGGIAFTAEPGRLVGERTFAGATIQVTLTKS